MITSNRKTFQRNATITLGYMVMTGKSVYGIGYHFVCLNRLQWQHTVLWCWHWRAIVSAATTTATTDGRDCFIYTIVDKQLNI